MRPPTDDRGVTVQIGTVLVFAILIVLLSVYQASVVPQQNADVEYKHNQRVQGQLQELRDELHRTAVTGSGGSASVTLGTQYPARAFFLNPPPPSGTLQTTSSATVTIDNAEAAGETGDYWNGEPRDFSTRGIVYEPVYHVYDDAPTTVYRTGVLYNRFDTATWTLTGQQLVEDNRISLVAVDGELSESGPEPASVGLQAVSAATRTVTVEDAGSDQITLTVPTELSVETWRDLLDSELDPEGDDSDKHVAAVENAGTDRIRVVLEPGTYELRLAKVGVGTDVTPVGAHYVTDVRGDNASVAEGTTQKLVVEVRDRYNNPVSGARVNLSLVSEEPGGPDDALVYRGESKDAFENLLTDSEGRVEVRFDADEFAGDTREEDVQVSIEDVPNADYAPTAKENLTFNLQVYNVDGPGRGGGGGGGDGPPSDELIRVVDGSTPPGESDQLTFKVENVGDSDVRITEFDVSTPGRQNSNVRQVDTLDTPNGNNEVDITGGGTDGYATPDYGRFDEAFATDGTTYALKREGNDGRGQEAVVTGGSDATVEMGGFNDGDVKLTYELTEDAADADLVATLTFEDGTSKTVYFRVTNVNS